jgi:hypothetical protein
MAEKIMVSDNGKPIEFYLRICNRSNRKNHIVKVPLDVRGEKVQELGN